MSKLRDGNQMIRTVLINYVPTFLTLTHVPRGMETLREQSECGHGVACLS